MGISRGDVLPAIGHGGLRIDVCEECQVTWLDGGELARIQLNYENSEKGRENLRTYVEFSSLSDIEKEEFAKTVADSVPRWEQIIGKEFLKAFLDRLLGSRYRW